MNEEEELSRVWAAVQRQLPDGWTLDLDKPPGLAEAIDWVSALHALGVTELDLDVARATIGALAKTPDDVDTVRATLGSATDPTASIPTGGTS